MIRQQTILCLLGLTNALPAVGSDPPNVVVIFADDVGYGDLSCVETERFNNATGTISELRS